MIILFLDKKLWEIFFCNMYILHRLRRQDRDRTAFLGGCAAGLDIRIRGEISRKGICLCVLRLLRFLTPA